MIYAKWDVDLADRPELVGLGFDALGMLGCVLAYCRKYETDGFVPSEASFLTRRGAAPVAAKLLAAKQIIEAPGGYYVPEYLRSNESKEDIEIARLSAKERKARWKVKNESGTDSERVPERVPDAFGTNSNSNSHSDLKKGEVQEREPPPGRKGRPRGTRMAPGWRPKPETLDWARGQGVDAEACVAEFVDHWLSDASDKACKLDWDATFRNRIRWLQDHNQAPVWTPPRQPATLPEIPEGVVTGEERQRHLDDLDAILAKAGRLPFEEAS